MPTVYCITGYPGAGKSAASSIAADLGYETIAMGDIVRQSAERDLGEDASSEEISRWATRARDEDEAIIARKTVEAIGDIDEDVVIDGIRSPPELDVFEEAFDRVTVVEVTAPDKIRYHRIVERGRRGEDGETLTERDRTEEEWGLDDLTNRADVTVPNDDALGALEVRISLLLDQE